MCGSRWRGVWGGGLSDDGSQGGTISIRLMYTYLKFLLLHTHSFFLRHIHLILHITCAHSIEQWETRNDAKVDQINRILKVHRICGRQFLCVKELKNNKIYRIKRTYATFSPSQQSTSRNSYKSCNLIHNHIIWQSVPNNPRLEMFTSCMSKKKSSYPQ